MSLDLNAKVRVFAAVNYTPTFAFTNVERISDHVSIIAVELSVLHWTLANNISRAVILSDFFYCRSGNCIVPAYKPFS